MGSDSQAIPEGVQDAMRAAGFLFIDSDACPERGIHRIDGDLELFLGRRVETTSWNDVVTDEDRSTVQHAIRGLIEGDEFTVRYRLEGADTEIWVEEAGVIHLVDGQTRVRSVIRSIDHQVQLETEVQAQRSALQEALASSDEVFLEARSMESQLRMVVRHAPFPLALLDHDLCYLEVSDRWLSEFGLADDVIGMSHLAALPHLPERWKQIYSAALEGDAVSVKEDEFVQPDGTTEVVRLRVRPVEESHGEIGGIVLFFEFVTARRRAEAEREEAFRALEHAVTDLEHAHELLEKTQEVARLGHFEFDLAARRFVEWSDEMARIWGVEEPPTFADWLQSIPEEDASVIRERAARAAETGEPFEGRHRIIRPDGEVRWVEGWTQIVHRNGTDVWIGTSRDITERRRLERQLRHSQRMETAGRLAGGVAHDFNNLLTAIFSFTDFALDELGDDHPARSELEEVLRASDRARDLTSQLLAFSRRRAVQPRLVDVNELLHSLDSMLSRVIPDDVEYGFQLQSDAWPTTIDPGALEQVIINLVVNACDAMPRGGNMVIETANVVVERPDAIESDLELVPGEYVTLAVSDQGDGIPPEGVSRVFEPFFTTKQPGEGTGLGLSTCYGIARQAGGGITVSSELGEGTTFTVYLPRGEGEPDPLPESDDFVAQGGDETILVTDDDRQVRALTARILERLGYSVHTAATGDEALDLVRELDEPIDLLVTDVVMPGMTGRELAEQFTAQRPAAGVLFISGYDDHIVSNRGGLSDRSRLLRKPFTPASLASAVRKSLASRPSDET